MKLYVGGLSYGTTERELEELFTAQGTVTSVMIIKDRFSGQSKGFAFVEMENLKEGQAAIQNLNGKDFGGRTLTVNQARPQDSRPSGGRPQQGGKGGGNFRRSY